MAGRDLKKIQFHYLYHPVCLKKRNPLKIFIAGLLKREGRQADLISFIFCTDEYLLKINQAHLKHDYYTDVITFSLSPPSRPLVAEIYISVERVKENAHSYKVSFKDELHRVMFHGVLHLCGYKDKSKVQQQKIKVREDYYLQQYFVPRGKISL